MTPRWIARILGIVFLIAFVLLMVTLQRKLVTIQRNRPTTTTSR